MATSKLQKYIGAKLRFYFSKYEILENTRPDWLLNQEGNRLELDFYIPTLNVAIEVQGDQHFEFCEFMHGDIDGFNRLKRDDAVKKTKCKERGITLVEITDANQLSNLVDRLDEYTYHSSTLPPISIIIDIEYLAYEQLRDKRKRDAEKNMLPENICKKNIRTIINHKRNSTQYTKATNRLIKKLMNHMTTIDFVEQYFLEYGDIGNEKYKEFMNALCFAN